jgi:hypothetical protein
MPISVIQRTRAIGFPLVVGVWTLFGESLLSQSSLAASTSSHGAGWSNPAGSTSPNQLDVSEAGAEEAGLSIAKSPKKSS